ncbi:glycerophosphodiester phosphodiesterase [Thermasporomyces composti]|uniref:Glycerophosphoryl diester phosphodiesterase n=1 Tax=Thermasporomyces composti TaxID=696763 RepID=A0A3D9V6U8_THECX|nr:glycerophosphodiester phosphodiesterase [Thermasporomyces composti]REF37046.1 glycerophosphoryl diester phosphodiesterase [Thermasporomyces composti]
MTFTLVGHRGAMGLEPENTLRSFRRAVEDGADAIELDLRLSADGHLVILHDGDVARTTNGRGEVARMTLAEIRELDAGDGEHVPTFHEVLDAVDVPIQAEIKAPEALPVAVDVIRDRRLLDRVTVTSFSVEVIRQALTLLPGLRTGLISSKAPREYVDLARSMGVQVLCFGIGALDAEVVDLGHRSHLQIMGWPVNDTERLLHALRSGADGVTSDVPGLLRNACDRNPEVKALLSGRLARQV